MANPQNKASKADVQSTKLNQMPVPGVNDTEFSAEEAAKVFKDNPSSGSSDQNQK
ncbi:hypothetical protein PASE110613_04900 [Paenibacillus sediminis]|uniref:YfhD family protein n=1 Tax=Paenibacillus sediminis TaxID=664909 RepID=A0ABS4H0W5_9BACL|nr:hypothetical protein [Paenibacillus sediminis]MBP1936111.1 hypothetical protein [Paenibacillus sediminis]